MQTEIAQMLINALTTATGISIDNRNKLAALEIALQKYEPNLFQAYLAHFLIDGNPPLPQIQINRSRDFELLPVSLFGSNKGALESFGGRFYNLLDNFLRKGDAESSENRRPSHNANEAVPWKVHMLSP